MPFSVGSIDLDQLISKAFEGPEVSVLIRDATPKEVSTLKGEVKAQADHIWKAADKVVHAYNDLEVRLNQEYALIERSARKGRLALNWRDRVLASEFRL